MTKSIKERASIAFTQMPEAGKEYIEGYMRGVLMVYEHMKEKEAQQSEKQPA